MQHLDNIEEVGNRIAVAFVATDLRRGVGEHLLPSGRSGKMKFKTS